ncbi:MAG: oxaloacetate decarboxylase [Epsilonproteobacteria bacterium]|nr:oxaloacetate decarboxylase [Campylobacterota bacterium]NPA63635.1 OadG family protein [Campylobacterota bacterium]
MILEAVKYMILGMGVVFVFLYLMVVVLDLQHKLLMKFFPESFEDSSKEPPVTTKREKLKKVAAITAALHHMKNS